MSLRTLASCDRLVHFRKLLGGHQAQPPISYQQIEAQREKNDLLNVTQNMTAILGLKPKISQFFTPALCIKLLPSYTAVTSDIHLYTPCIPITEGDAKQSLPGSARGSSLFQEASNPWCIIIPLPCPQEYNNFVPVLEEWVRIVPQIVFYMV